MHLLALGDIRLGGVFLDANVVPFLSLPPLPPPPIFTPSSASTLDHNKSNITQRRNMAAAKGRPDNRPVELERVLVSVLGVGGLLA